MVELDKIYTGDCRVLMREWVAAGIRAQTVVTSPPYWGLRRYGCPPITFEDGWTGELGLEPSHLAYVCHLVEIFRSVRELLRDDGTLWLNIGDTYITGNRGNHKQGPAITGRKGRVTPSCGAEHGLKLKNMALIPQRLSIALQDDGWWVRRDIIWFKTNPMPESADDRPTTAHEYVWLLAKGQWKSRVVHFTDLSSERFHLLKDFRSNGLAVRDSTRLPVDLATAIFDGAQREECVGLPPFYAEVWQQCNDGGDSDFVRGLPIEHRASVWAARFLCANASAEQFMSETNRILVALPNGYDLLKRWTTAYGATAPSITSDGKGTVTVHYAGEICKVDFPNHLMIVSRPSKGSYYYNADAIKEPCSPDTHARMKRAKNNGYAPPGQPPHHGSAGAARQNTNNNGVGWGYGDPDPKPRTAGVNPKARIPSGWDTGDGNHRGLGGRYVGIGDSGTGRRDGGRVKQNESFSAAVTQPVEYRNKRSVWEIPTSPYSGAHFATFPEGLVEPCILAGSRHGDLVVDPFMGSGTVAAVAKSLGRHYLGSELHPDYERLHRERSVVTAGMAFP